VPAEVRGEALGHADDAGLGDAVPEVRVRLPGRDRGEVDDAPLAPRDHLLRHRPDQLHRRLGVDAQDAAAHLLGVTLDRHRVLHASVVDQDVNLAERVDQLRDSRKVREVVGNFTLKIESQDTQAGLLQRLGGGEADAARGAGD